MPNQMRHDNFRSAGSGRPEHARETNGWVQLSATVLVFALIDAAKKKDSPARREARAFFESGSHGLYTRMCGKDPGLTMEGYRDVLLNGAENLKKIARRSV
jgi:hypothetical protein